MTTSTVPCMAAVRAVQCYGTSGACLSRS